MTQQTKHNAIRLTLRKCEYIDDWWIIERAEHDGRAWMEQIESGVMALRTSARFSENADVEGTTSEMLEIAEAIRTRGSFSAKRCSVDATTPEVHFSSPRNSMHDGVTTIEFADELVAVIEAQCARDGKNVV